MASFIKTDPDRVSNKFPTIKAPYKIAIIGDAPGFDEVNQKQPFVGQAGRLLSQCLQQVMIAPNACFLGNISPYRPPNSTISRFAWDCDEIQGGMVDLRNELNQFDPNIVVLLGEVPLKAAKDPITKHPLVPAAFRFKPSAYRGSLFICDQPESPFFKRKCLASYHPVKVLQIYELLLFLQFDLRRARLEGVKKELELPQRRLDIHLSAHEIIQRLKNLQPFELVSIDIEGGIVAERKSKFKDPETGEALNEKKPSCVPCLAISTDPSEAFIINFGSHSEYEERKILHQLSLVCYDLCIPKLFQNGVYDTFVMWWMFKILVRNHAHDTMLSGWELYPELPKALGVQASIWTREPYWKHDRKTDDPNTFLEYCCKDAAVTLEIHQRQMEVMTIAQQDHYHFNCCLLPLLFYMELKGMRWNQLAADEAGVKLTVEIQEHWARIQTFASLHNAPEHAKNKGEYLNPASPKQMNDVLYDRLGYPSQYKIEAGRKTNKRTNDKLALLNLLKIHPNDTFLFDILQWRKKKKVLMQARTSTDSDGRIRSSYNPVGTDTGRLSCQAAPTGKGMNLTTLTKPLRHLIQADEGYYFFQIDLEGADGWTVACRCKELTGDDTMLEDYRYGIKPANVIALSYLIHSPSERVKLLHITNEYGTNLAKWSRELLKDVAAEFVDKNGWLYFTSKRVQHGGNYGLGKIQMSNQILQDSYKLAPAPILLPPKQCDELKRLYLGGRYVAVQSWQNWVKKQLLEYGSLDCASGHKRRFFGRKSDNQTLNSALSHEPQANTTYVTNLGLYNIWIDPDNRDASGGLIIQPLHQVHDAVCGQFPIEKEEWAKKKLREYMNNEITIAGEKLVIPYEGEYGDSWGKMDKGTIYMKE